MGTNLELKHHKDFHRVQFQGLSMNQRNLVFALCCKVMNQEDNLLVFNISEMSSLSKLKKRKMSNKEMFDYLESLYNTLKKTSIKIKKENGVKIFSLFIDYESFEDEGKFQIKVNSSFRYMLNDIKEPFTIQNLEEYTNLKSGYSQLLYSLLKEWEKKKEHTFTIDEFRNDLGIPETYDFDIINKRVLNQILKELPPYFPNLKLEKIKTGKRVTSLKFTWSRKIEKIEPKKTDDVIDIITISEELNQVIEKAKKNRFIEKLLTIDNIEILTQMFQENDLVKGLLWAYKEVSQDVSSLNYLIKTIRTGIEKKEKKLIVKKSEDKQESIFDKTFQEIPLDFKEDEIENEKQEVENSIIKQKVTMDQYEELYKKYLEENQTEHNPYVRKSFELYSKIRYEIVEDEEDTKIEVIEDTYNHYLTEEMDRLAVITEISDNDLLNKMAKSILDKKYKVVPFEFSNPIHIGELDEAIKRDYTMEARLRYTERDHLNYLKYNENAINFADLDRNLLLSKSGKMLTGGALEARLEKIAKDLKKVIFYKNKIIGNMWETY